MDALIVHARKAWLKGLSPRENRDIPPLDYALVRRLKAACPDLAIILNGDLASVEQAQEQIEGLDGIMMGRAAYQNPWRLLQVDPEFFGLPAPFNSAKDALVALVPYIEDELAKGTRLSSIARHVLGLFQGVPGARAFRRHLAMEAIRSGAGASVLADALAKLQERPAKPIDVKGSEISAAIRKGICVTDWVTVDQQRPEKISTRKNCVFLTNRVN